MGFRDLSARAVPPAPQPAAAPEPPPVMVSTAGVAPIKAIYNGSDAGVVPPVIVKQGLPPFQREMFPARDGVLEILINEAGQVEAAAMRLSMNPRYDTQVISAARSWRYQPATVEGVPVKFRKVINISLKGVS